MIFHKERAKHLPLNFEYAACRLKLSCRVQRLVLYETLGLITRYSLQCGGTSSSILFAYLHFQTLFVYTNHEHFVYTKLLLIIVNIRICICNLMLTIVTATVCVVKHYKRNDETSTALSRDGILCVTSWWKIQGLPRKMSLIDFLSCFVSYPELRICSKY